MMLHRLVTSSKRFGDPVRVRWHPLFSTSPFVGTISGHATPEGTLSFVKDANLPLYHKFDKTGLYINPVIHAQPHAQYMLKIHAEASASLATPDACDNYMRSSETDDLAGLALRRNRSNCLYVYSYNSRQSEDAVGPSGERLREQDQPFYLSNIRSLLVPAGFGGDPATVPAGAVSRECVVTVADIGCTLDPTEIRTRVNEATQLTGLDTIDCIVWRATEDCMFDIDAFDACVAELGRLCSPPPTSLSADRDSPMSVPRAQFFGIYFYNIPPYCYYTPPRAIEDVSSLFPAMIEGDLKEESGTGGRYEHCDLVLYKISPAHTFPGTYPMLDSDGTDAEADVDLEAGAGADAGSQAPSAQDPLSVMRSVKAGLRQQPVPQPGEDNARRGGKDSSSSGHIPVDESTGNDEMDMEVERVFREQEAEDQEEARARGGISGPKAGDGNGDGNEDERMLESNRQYTRAAVDCLHCYPGTGAYDHGEDEAKGGNNEGGEEEEEEEVNQRHQSGSIAAIVGESGPTPDASSSGSVDDSGAMDAILAKTQQMMQAQGGKLTKEQNNAIYTELLDAQATQIQSQGAQSGRGRRSSESGSNTIHSNKTKTPEDSEVIVDEEASAHNPTILLSSLYSPEVEAPLHAVLEHLCPHLKQVAVSLDAEARQMYGFGPEVTSTLQHKAMRVSYSVGVDVLVMDAYTSAALGKVDDITVHDLLTPNDTSRVFGQFGVPKE